MGPCLFLADKRVGARKWPKFVFVFIVWFLWHLHRFLWGYADCYVLAGALQGDGYSQSGHVFEFLSSRHVGIRTSDSEWSYYIWDMGVGRGCWSFINVWINKSVTCNHQVVWIEIVYEIRNHRNFYHFAKFIRTKILKNVKSFQLYYLGAEFNLEKYSYLMTNRNYNNKELSVRTNLERS